ncbi:MAG: restriction endonuclease subunit S, partial [Chloroflexi bacterium]|nr:restriction endonuclease subunit S [Chloroflexota bacterium]
FAGLLFRTPVFSAECGRRSHGIVWDRLRLYWEEFRDISVPLPSTSEQKALLAQVAQETKKLDDLADATKRTIVLLKERRSGLIAAAVTGQITVWEE